MLHFWGLFRQYPTHRQAQDWGRKGNRIFRSERRAFDHIVKQVLNFDLPDSSLISFFWEIRLPGIAAVQKFMPRRSSHEGSWIANIPAGVQGIDPIDYF
jgi:hypothetical protein